MNFPHIDKSLLHILTGFLCVDDKDLDPEANWKCFIIRITVLESCAALASASIFSFPFSSWSLDNLSGISLTHQQCKENALH